MLAVFLYIMGLLLAWVYEIKRNALYLRMREQVKSLEIHQMRDQKSSAVLRVRMYKINEDYRKSSMGLERVQQFILEKVLLIRRGTFKTEYKK
jgi:hypothetical protein